ncbi:MAG TPA: PIN domain-containing protein [Candidatus Binatia bacterium]|nr:PIN domain-containing protein [Candidatus Binatia bacterium]
MTYLDSSVALAYLFAENRRPPDDLWDEPLLSSRLLHYEVWTRVQSRQLARAHGDQVRDLLGGVTIVELFPHVLARAIEPFPTPVRTLDALHLATMDFLRGHGYPVELASYDARLLAAARALGIALRAL